MTVLPDDTGGTIDEGRAMAEIIYDEAPGITEMYFSTGTISAAGKAASINNLVAAGVKIIADDIFYLDEPMFQDGVVAQAVDAATAAGVNYFASAGNRARQSWEGTYTGATDNDFDPGAGVDTIQTLGTFTNRSPFISLQWAEPWGAATTNLALDWYVDGVLVASPATTTTSPPASRTSSRGSPSPGTHTLGIGIRRVAGTGTPFMKYIVGGDAGLHDRRVRRPTPTRSTPTRRRRPARWPWPPANWSTPTTPEPFSSRGPSITRLFTAAGVPHGAGRPPQAGAGRGRRRVDDRARPSLTFFGTSAATPERGGHRDAGPLGDPDADRRPGAGDHDRPDNAQACATADAGRRLRSRLHHGRPWRSVEGGAHGQRWAAVTGRAERRERLVHDAGQRHAGR